MDLDEDVVIITPIPDEDGDTICEVRISCPDATGLGCDITRLLLDFGLRILQGDISTDGKWCFIIFRVQLSSGVPPHWALLKRRLETVCPTPTGNQLWRWNSNPKDFQHPFLLQVASYDRVGVLHDLINTLWECDVVVFKAHITTSPSSEVLDMFWIYDNRQQLPEYHRVLEISDRVKQCTGRDDAKCSITPAPADTCEQDSTATIIQRCACKDARPIIPLRKIISRKGSVAKPEQSIITSEKDEYGELETCEVKVDNSTAAAYSLVHVRCADRKGLTYDLMRTLKDIHIRVAYGKVTVHDEDGTCEVDLFVQEVDGTRINTKELQEELVARLRMAVTLPVRISIKDVYDDTCTELMVSASLDSGGRGRPRVTYDVTAALNAVNIAVFMADVYIEPIQADVDRRPMELHRFLVHFWDGTRLESIDEKRCVYEYVRASLMGTEVHLKKRPMSPSSATIPPLVGGGGGGNGAAGVSLVHKMGHSLSNWKW